MSAAKRPVKFSMLKIRKLTSVYNVNLIFQKSESHKSLLYIPSKARNRYSSQKAMLFCEFSKVAHGHL